MKERLCEREQFWVYVLLAGTLPATNSKEGLRPVLFRPLGVARDKQRVIGTCKWRLIGKFACRGRQVVAAVGDKCTFADEDEGRVLASVIYYSNKDERSTKDHCKRLSPR